MSREGRAMVGGLALLSSRRSCAGGQATDAAAAAVSLRPKKGRGTI